MKGYKKMTSEGLTSDQKLAAVKALWPVGTNVEVNAPYTVGTYTGTITGHRKNRKGEPLIVLDGHGDEGGLAFFVSEIVKLRPPTPPTEYKTVKMARVGETRVCIRCYKSTTGRAEKDDLTGSLLYGDDIERIGASLSVCRATLNRLLWAGWTLSQDADTQAAFRWLTGA